MMVANDNFPFLSSLSSRAAAYLNAPELMRVRVCLCSCVNFILARPIPHMPFVYYLYVNTASLPC